MFLLLLSVFATAVANGDDNDHEPRPMGIVELQSDGTCPPGKFSGGDRCIEFAVVDCPDIADVVGALRVTGTGAVGTVVLTTGGQGTGLFGNQSGDIVAGFLDALLDDGYLLVELAWDDLGNVNPPGVWEGPGTSTSLACRPATALDWIFDTLHEEGLSVAQGNSGGSAQIAFSLAYYGSDVLDLANLSGGPPPCPISTEGVLNFGEQEACVVDAALFNDTWEPLLFGDPRTHYPNTTVRFFIGKDEPSSYITETADNYHDRITSDTSIRFIPHADHQVQRTEKGSKAMLASIRKSAHTSGSNIHNENK